MKNRRGAIEISEMLLREDPEIVLNIFNSFGFLPLTIEGKLYRNTYTYYGVSKEFFEVPEGQKLPHYAIEANKDHDTGKTEYKLRGPDGREINEHVS